jgi:DNA-binding beta-propeller fold protein YncE
MIRGAIVAAAVFIVRFPTTGRARATLRRIVLARAIAPLLLALAALTGCGSVDDVPPAAAPATSPPLTERPAGRIVAAAEQPDRPVAGLRAPVDQGRAVAVLDPRERVLEVRDTAGETIGRAAAGVGPTRVVGGRGGLIYVLDTGGDGLLVYELRPRLHLTRRLPVLGSPSGIASDTVNQRLWITTTATNRLVELADGARPHRLRAFPAVRQPDSVTVDPERRRVYVSGRADDVVQILDVEETATRTPRTARR